MSTFAWLRTRIAALSVILGLALAPGVAHAATRATTDGTTTDGIAAQATPTLTYQAHVQDVGWQTWVEADRTAGTTGKSLRVEALRLWIAGAQGGVICRAHVQNIGWQDWGTASSIIGTTGQGLRVEALEAKLTGAVSDEYDLQYRAHVQDLGWQDWVSNGATAGTTGRSLRIEAVQFRLVARQQDTPLPTSDLISYVAHVQTIGWQGWVKDGETTGTVGQGLRVEALRLRLGDNAGGGSIIYRAHVQDIGWQPEVRDGSMAGTSGKSLRIEALQVRLAGTASDRYDVYYRAHVQDVGWLGWAHDGETSGSVGLGLQVEAVEVRLVAKDGEAPGNTDNHEYRRDLIMGESLATRADAITLFKSLSTYPSDIYASKGASTIDDFVDQLFDEAEAEGVRADIAFCQAMHETGWLRFGGDVRAEQCNFAGIGATGGGNPGNSFENVRIGLRAQVQHLKAYASTRPLVNPCVDPRFRLVTRGCAPSLQDLTQRWAIDSSYGENIARVLDRLDRMS